jgi:hypothetical protein
MTLRPARQFARGLGFGRGAHSFSFLNRLAHLRAANSDRRSAPSWAKRSSDAPNKRPAAQAKEVHAMRISLGFALIFLASQIAAAEPELSIERLLSEGWEIAGYASGYDNCTSLLLFRHAGKNALVQCGVLYDVTRNPRTIVNCYELR